MQEGGQAIAVSPVQCHSGDGEYIIYICVRVGMCLCVYTVSTISATLTTPSILY